MIHVMLRARVRLRDRVRVGGYTFLMFTPVMKGDESK